MDRYKDLLARCWTEAADLYVKELVPRFQPWTLDALAALKEHETSLPPGNVVVPCCGPGHELLALSSMLSKPPRSIIGIDLSEGMVSAANAVCQAANAQKQIQIDARAVVGDAVTGVEAYKPVAAVFSVFGLQQMGTEAPKALSNWVTSLEEGGVAVVMFWPPDCETDGPWAAMEAVVAEHHAKSGTTSHTVKPGANDWEQALVGSVEQCPGASLLSDTRIEHEVVWESPEQFWEVLTEGGAWRARRITFGDGYMSELQSAFLRRMPPGRLRHTWTARMMVAKRMPRLLRAALL